MRARAAAVDTDLNNDGTYLTTQAQTAATTAVTSVTSANTTALATITTEVATATTDINTFYDTQVATAASPPPVDTDLDDDGITDPPTPTATQSITASINAAKTGDTTARTAVRGSFTDLTNRRETGVTNSFVVQPTSDPTGGSNGNIPSAFQSAGTPSPAPGTPAPAPNPPAQGQQLVGIPVPQVDVEMTADGILIHTPTDHHRGLTITNIDMFSRLVGTFHMDGSNDQLGVFFANLPQILALGEKLQAANVAMAKTEEKMNAAISERDGYFNFSSTTAEYAKIVNDFERQLAKDAIAVQMIKNQLQQLGKNLGLEEVTFSGTSQTVTDDTTPHNSYRGQGLYAALVALATTVTPGHSNDGLQDVTLYEFIKLDLFTQIGRVAVGAIVSRILSSRAATTTLYSYSATPLAGSAFASTTGRIYLTTWGPGEWLYARGLWPGILRSIRTGRFSPYPVGAAVFTTGPIVPSAFGLARIFPQTANFWKFFGGQFRSGLGVNGYAGWPRLIRFGIYRGGFATRGSGSEKGIKVSGKGIKVSGTFNDALRDHFAGNGS